MPAVEDWGGRNTVKKTGNGTSYVTTTSASPKTATSTATAPATAATSGGGSGGSSGGGSYSGGGYSGGGYSGGSSGGTAASSYTPVLPVMPDYSGILQVYRDLAAKQEAAAQQSYESSKAAAQKAYDDMAATRQTSYDQSAGRVNEVANKALQEAYVNRMMGERNLGQQLSALGRSGGAAESTLLGLANQYGRVRGQHEGTRAESLGDLLTQLQTGQAEDRRVYNDALLNSENTYQNMLTQARNALAESEAQVLMQQAEKAAAIEQARQEAEAQATWEAAQAASQQSYYSGYSGGGGAIASGYQGTQKMTEQQARNLEAQVRLQQAMNTGRFGSR